MDDFYKVMQRKVAITAVGPSALRGQGRGVLGASQELLAHINLATVPNRSDTDYNHWLDEMTDRLLKSYDLIHQPWGAARKALNLFM